MIHIEIYKDCDTYNGFQVSGHSGYADAGSDIVCAAVSALVLNTINSIEQFTEDDFELTSDVETGFIKVSFNDKLSHDAQLLVDSMVLGLDGVCQDSQGYIEIIFKEE